MSYQRCLRCGTDEASGGYCTFCRWQEYELIEHNHFGVGEGSGCPLGQVDNPGPARTFAHSKRAEEVNLRFLADPIPDGAEQYVIRRWVHPQNPDVAVLERPAVAAAVTDGARASS